MIFLHCKLNFILLQEKFSKTIDLIYLICYNEAAQRIPREELMITAKELAKQLNLSEAAVSMALNGKVGVSEKTRARVLAAAKQQGYDFSRIKERQFEREHPEGNILFLIFKKHGAVVADTPFFSELTQGIEAETRKQGYRLLVRYVYEEDSRAQFSLAAKEGFGGAVILGTEMDEGDLPLLSLLPFPDTTACSSTTCRGRILQRAISSRNTARRRGI